MGRSKDKTVPTLLLCSHCGSKMVIHRLVSRLKKTNHIKDMYCYVCKQKRKFVEIRENDYHSLNLNKNKREY